MTFQNGKFEACNNLVRRLSRNRPRARPRKRPRAGKIPLGRPGTL